VAARQRAGNPRANSEHPAPTRAGYARSETAAPHDEPWSCGPQPAYISLTARRAQPAGPPPTQPTTPHRPPQPPDQRKAGNS
jgi:hypothetical protein